MLTFSAVRAPTRSLHAHVDAGQQVHIHDGRLHDPVNHDRAIAQFGRQTDSGLLPHTTRAARRCARPWHSRWGATSRVCPLSWSRWVQQNSFSRIPGAFAAQR